MQRHASGGDAMQNAGQASRSGSPARARLFAMKAIASAGDLIRLLAAYRNYPKRHQCPVDLSCQIRQRILRFRHLHFDHADGGGLLSSKIQSYFMLPHLRCRKESSCAPVDERARYQAERTPTPASLADRGNPAESESGFSGWAARRADTSRKLELHRHRILTIKD